jgi:hypothetical protein
MDTKPAMTPEQAYQRLQVWFEQSKQLAELKTSEILARKELANFYFAKPQKGVNRLDLGGGFDLKLDYGFDYTVDEAALDSVKASDVKRLKLPMDDLIVYKPVLSLREYNKLNAEQKKFVDEFIDAKEKSPQLHIVASVEATSAITGDPDTPAANARRKAAPRKTTRKRK